MATLRDLKPSLSDLPYSMQIELHENIRVSRLVPKKMRTKAATKRKEVKKSKIKVLYDLTPEQAKSILKHIESIGG